METAVVLDSLGNIAFLIMITSYITTPLQYLPLQYTPLQYLQCLGLLLKFNAPVKWLKNSHKKKSSSKFYHLSMTVNLLTCNYD